MFLDNSFDASLLARTIQLAIAPVFLLTAIGAFLTVITTRLGRVIDRARHLEAAMQTGGELDETKEKLARAELASLDRRMLLANRAVGLAVGSALVVCLLITLLFVSAISPLHPDMLVPILFGLALVLLMSALLTFLIEVRISIRTVRVRAELLQNAPSPPGDFRFRELRFPR